MLTLSTSSALGLFFCLSALFSAGSATASGSPLPSASIRRPRMFAWWRTTGVFMSTLNFIPPVTRPIKCGDSARTILLMWLLLVSMGGGGGMFLFTGFYH